VSGQADGAVISVVVADDHEVVRAGFAALLDTQPDFTVLGTACDGAQAVAACLSLRPDVVLMDIRMPGTDGIEATQRLTAADDPPRVLILTTFDLDEYVFDALRAGASGFLLKDVTAERLFEAVRVVAEGLSNTEIAGRLVVTEETVKTHVSRILSKLGLRDRTQAVVVAYESGLVVPGRLADIRQHKTHTAEPVQDSSDSTRTEG
jgi:DNA-binding NarL/FixJ family response regulator